MRTQQLFATLAVAAALAPATARAQGGDAAKTGEDIKKFLDPKKPDAAQVKREIDITIPEEVDLRDVMDEIGRRVGKNIVVEPDIHEKVQPLTLRKIPWLEAVQVIVKMSKCELEQRGALYVVTQPPKVTIQFTDANVRTVLQLLAAYSGKNIIISPEVQGNVTLDLHEVHWMRALKAIVKTVGDYEVVEETDNGDLIRVVPRSSIALSLKTEYIPLKYPPPAGQVHRDPAPHVGRRWCARGGRGQPVPRPAGDADGRCGQGVHALPRSPEHRTPPRSRESAARRAACSSTTSRRTRSSFAAPRR